MDRDDERIRERVTSWASAGSWDPPSPPDDPPPPPPPPKKPPKKKVDRPFRDVTKELTLGRRGVVCGRFHPLHRGHEHLLQYAASAVEHLDVFVFHYEDDLVPAPLRAAWLRAIPGLGAEVAVRETPALPKGPLTSDMLTVALRQGRKYDFFFTSEGDIARYAAKAIGATYVPVDPPREVLHASGTAIRADVMKSFDDLSEHVRPWFVRRVAVVGAESTGKSELCKRLAEIYGTVFVPERFRALAEARGGTLDVEAIELAAVGQMADERALAFRARRVLFCDTDLATVGLWSERIFGAKPPGLDALVDQRPYDLTLYCAADVPFVGPAANDQPTARADLDKAIGARIANRKNVVSLRGTWEKRLLDARKAIDHLLARKDFFSARGETLATVTRGG